MTTIEETTRGRAEPCVSDPLPRCSARWSVCRALGIEAVQVETAGGVACPEMRRGEPQPQGGARGRTEP